MHEGKRRRKKERKKNNNVEIFTLEFLDWEKDLMELWEYIKKYGSSS